MTSTVQPAWVLGRRPYRDSSLLVDLLTAQVGRASVVVKGAHRRQRGGSFASLMQPFSPLLVGLGGKAELKYLATAEGAGRAISMPPERLFSALYMNELLILLLPKFDSAPRLFSEYGVSLERLANKPEPDLTLRRFELTLFDELGYQVPWLFDNLGRSVVPERLYIFSPERGFVVANSDTHSVSVSGVELETLSRWQANEAGLPDGLRLKLKHMMRQAVDYRLAGRTLKVRAAVNEWRDLSREKGV